VVTTETKATNKAKTVLLNWRYRRQSTKESQWMHFLALGEIGSAHVGHAIFETFFAFIGSLSLHDSGLSSFWVVAFSAMCRSDRRLSACIYFTSTLCT
jgi:hypothetical protein